MTQDHYAVLGIEREATPEEVRRAFRKIAAESHPDRNPGNKAAEQRFKEANEAFQVLSDDSKRRMYDLTVAADRLRGFGARQDQGAGPVGDFFRSHPFKPPRRPEQAHDFSGRVHDFSGRGEDITLELALDLRSAVYGCRKSVHVKASRPTSRCGACNGSGTEPGSRRVPCQSCAGAGRAVDLGSTGPRVGPCPACRGSGFISIVNCRACQGRGRVAHEADVVVTVPAGVDTGSRLRLAGQGAPGSPPGDLFLDVRVERHESYGRKGPDLFTQVDVPLKTALGGGTVPVPLLDGNHILMHVDPMTQSGSILAVRGLGVKSPLAGTSGDLHVQVHVKFPPHLNARAQRLLEELAEELG